jgi:hypothetical protein
VPEDNLRVDPGNEKSPSDKPPPAEATRRDRRFVVGFQIVAHGYEIVVARRVVALFPLADDHEAGVFRTGESGNVLIFLTRQKNSWVSSGSGNLPSE